MHIHWSEKWRLLDMIVRCVCVQIIFSSLIIILINCPFCFFTGVHDENVRTYNPKVVRIGLKAHHSVQSVCMDNLVCLGLITNTGYCRNSYFCYNLFLHGVYNYHGVLYNWIAYWRTLCLFLFLLLVLPQFCYI